MRRPDSFKEQQGYLTFAQNNSTTNYLELAYLQALSIKATQKINSYAVVVDAKTKEALCEKHRKVFDYIIDMPGEDLAADSDWKLANEWKAWWATPYKETVKLDSDILFTRNIDHWWDAYRLRDVFFTTQVVDHRGDFAASRKYRQLFDDNDLLNVYTGLFYFRFSQTSLYLFEIAAGIYKEWDYFKNNVLKNCRDEQPTTDVVFALAAKLLGEEQCYVPLSYPTFAHMKGAMLNMGSFDTWRNKMYAQLDGKDLLIGFNKQMYPVHYQDKEFATQELIKKYEDLWTTVTKNS